MGGFFSGSIGKTPADPIVPADGTQNITGALSVTGSSDVVTLKAKAFSGQLSDMLNINASDNSSLAKIDINGKFTAASFGNVDATGGSGNFAVVNVQGTSDIATLTARAFAGQTTKVLSLAKSDNTPMFTVSPTGVVASAAQTITGVSDTTQLKVIANPTQTTALLDLQNSALTSKFSVSNTGVVNVASNIVVGAGNISVGNGQQYQNFNGTSVIAFPSNGAVQLGSGLSVSGVTAVKTSNYTATAADSLVLADPNAAAGSFAITLPAANAAKGQLLTVKVVATHATRVITVIKAGSDTIESTLAAQSTVTFGTTLALASATFQSDGTSKWYLIGSNGTVT